MWYLEISSSMWDESLLGADAAVASLFVSQSSWMAMRSSGDIVEVRCEDDGLWYQARIIYNHGYPLVI